MDTRGELWTALYQNGKWRQPELVANDEVEGFDIALTNDGDVVVAWLGYVALTWRVSAGRYQRRLDGWCASSVLAKNRVSAPLVGVDAQGTATVVWGGRNDVLAARQSCRN